MTVLRGVDKKAVRRCLTVGITASVVWILAACSGGQPAATATLAPLPTLTPVPPATAAPLPTDTPAPPPTAAPALSTEPRAGSVPTPSFPPAPTATLAPAGPTSEALADTALHYLTGLVENLGPRQSATGQERRAAEYLAARLESLGYAVDLQTFSMEMLSSDSSAVVLEGPDPERVSAVPLIGSATGDATGILVPVGLGREADMPAQGLEGNIALAERGLISFEEKVNRAVAAGAAAVVIYNNLPGNYQGFLSSSGVLPVLSISREDGERIEELVSAGPVEATVSVRKEEIPSQNVIAERPGTDGAVVVLGAHYDTVPDIAGADDNASGTAVLLAVAQELSRKSFPFTVRFIAFGSEELGLLGSRHYVDSLDREQRGRIKAMLNFDTAGSGAGLAVLGGEELTALAVAQAAALGIEVETSEGLRGAGSDHMSFAGAGIPAIMFFGEDFSRIHTPADTLEFVAPGLLGEAAALAVAMLESQKFPAALD